MMSFKEFKATVCTPKVAGPHKDIKTTTTTTTTSKTTTNKSDSAKDLTVLPTTSSSSSSSSSSSTQSITTSSLSSSTSLTEETHMKLSKLFSFIDDTYRDIRRYNSGLYKDSYSTQLMKTINKYKNGCNEVFGKVLESYDMSLKLSQNIVRTIDIFKNLSSCLTDMEEYNYRICEIMSIFIVCELRLSVEAALQDQLLIAHRIIYIMRRHLVQEEENETLYNILRTLVYIPKLFNARDIMCAIFGQFIPIKPVPEVNVLPDKLYMLYIIVFYRWMMMQKDDDDKMLIVNFAESFMKPSVSLCSNNLYGAYLPMYTTHSTATRTILNNLKYYRDIRNACMIDNALKKIGSVVNLCDDDEDDDIIVLDTCSRTDFVQAYTSVLNLEPLSGSLSNIKLEEKTIVETVDLTDVEETTNSLFERHEKWLNEFQLLAKQSRESQLLLEKQQQNKEMISTAVICLDSDSEGEENEDVTESNRRKQKETEEEKGVAATSESNKPAILNQNTNSSNNCEDLFVDSYPITTTPINCDTDVESLETEEDADDETKISPRFLSGNLRTYQAKKSNHSFGGLEDKRNTDAEVEADADTELDDNDKAYRRDSIHISSTPPERVEQDEDDGTDVQDEHDDDDLLEEEEETNAYTILPTTIAQKTTNEKEIFAKQIRPMGPYPTYNNLHNSNSTNNDKVVFSQTLQRYPSASAQHQHQQHTLHHDKQYYSDGWDMKSSKKQKKKVQFNTSPLGPTASSLTKKVPLKPALQPTKYKASDAPEYFHLRGFERFSCAPSIAGSTSTSASNSTSSSFKQQEQQESTLNLCINKNINIQNNNNNNKCSNLYKNLSVFNQKSLNIKQEKSMKNVKINLKKIKLNNDISLTNFKNNYHNLNEKKQEQEQENEQQQEQPHTLDTNNIQLNLNSNTNQKTEFCLLKTNPNANPNNNEDDDKLFKKPLPVTRKLLKSSKPLKIFKVVSLRRSLPYYNKLNPSNVIKTETIEQENEHKEFNVKVKVNESGNDQANDINESKLENTSNESDFDLDDLSKISKLLTEEINNLTEIKQSKEVQPQEEEKEKLNSQETPNETKINEVIIQETSRDNEGKIIEQETNKDPINEESKQHNVENEEESTNMYNDIEAAQEKEEQEITTEKTTDSVEENESDKESCKTNEESEKEKVLTELQQDKEMAAEIEKEIVEEVSKKLQHDSEIDIKQKELSLEEEDENKEKLRENETPNYNETKTKDGKTMEESQANEEVIIRQKTTLEQEIIIEEKSNLEKETPKQNLSLENDQGEKEEEATSTQQASSLDKDKENFSLVEEKSDLEKTEKSQKIITNFCAEFLAGLPNEPSPALNDSTENETETRSDMDFEFENNCTTPTIDLDVMTENTSDISSTMPLTRLASEECEADKLLEDFNHRTEDIVGIVLNKKPITDSISTKECLVGNATFKTNNEFKSLALKDDNNDKENLKRLRDEDNAIEDELNKTMKKVKNMDTTVEQQTENEIEENSQVLVDSKIATPLTEILSEPEKSLAEMMPESEAEIAKSSAEILPETECQSPKSLTEILTESETQIAKPPNKSSTETLEGKELDEQNVNEFNTVEEGVKEQENKNIRKSNDLEESPKSHKKSSSSKKSKKSNKHSKKHEKTQSSPNDNNEDLSKSPKQEYVSKELINEDNMPETVKENSTEDRKDSTAVQQMETSLNENQHMTLELGNWKQENECKTNDSESSAGVSAIFSFPKIPIISISICTTPNNKTYFKISNRENDNQAKENNKNKKIKSSSQDNETDADDNADSKETNKNKENLSKEIPEDCNEEDEEEEGEMEHEEDEEVDEEEETDNMEIEKFSHDSNSACSLPLKKRPTQAEHNEETEDSQHIIATSYEQAQDIAAEVVIENSDKDRSIVGGDNVQLQDDLEREEEEKESDKVSEQTAAVEVQAVEATTQVLYTEYDDNKPSTSANCFKKLSDPSSPFKRRVHIPLRPVGQPPIQIVAPQLKDNTTSPPQDHRMVETQVPSVPMRIQTQSTQQTLPESYPATPMLSVANVEKLMDFNRFIEDLLASPDVMTIIDNANACGYYAEGQAYEMERIAILEHYNIANAKGNTSVTKPLYWKKSAGDTISIFNDNDNEWIALPPSTAKQLLKLSFVLSILQQQYKVSDVRQRINIALTFLIQTSYTSKFKNNSANNSSSLQQRMQMYSRNISDNNSNQHNITSQPLPSTSYFRIATNNENLNTSFNMTSNFENVQDYSNNQVQTEIVMQQDNTVGAAGIGGGNQQNWNNLIQFSNPVVAQVMEQTTSTNSPQRMEYETIQQQQQQQQQIQDKRTGSWEELNTDQLYINPPCATSPQNEVIVNTNGVQLHEMPQDQQNIFISITDESGPTSNGGSTMENSLHKYNTRQQQQQHLRALEEVEQQTCSPSSSSSSSSSSSAVAGQQQSYAKRPCLGITNHFQRNNIITTFGNQEINLKNPYRVQHLQQKQHQQQHNQQNLNTNSNINFQQRLNISNQNNAQNLPINIYNNPRHTTTSSPLIKPQQQRLNTATTTSTPSLSQAAQATAAVGPTSSSQIKVSESNYKEILQPYITYLIKDHEKTSKHLLQVFEEVSNSNTIQSAQDNSNFTTNLQQHQQRHFNSLLPPLIRNPQQNHMPGFHQITSVNSNNNLPSLIRNPHRDSGALQVVQSFIEQSQTTPDNNSESQRQQQQQLSPTPPGFVSEYVNFVGSRDGSLLNLNIEQTKQQQQHQHQQQEKNLQKQQEIERLNCAKRKCQERNDQLAEDLKRKMMEFSMLKHNVQTKLLEKQLQGQVKQIENTNQNKRRGRPKRTINQLYNEDNAKTSSTNLSLAAETKDKRHNRTSGRTNKKHLAAAATLFRNIFDRPPTTTATTRLPFTYSGPFSPSSSSISSRSLTSPAATPNTPDTTRKKSRLPKNKKQTIKQRRSTLGNREDLNSTNSSGNLDEQQYSIIRKREVLKDAGGSYRSRLDGGPPGVPSYGYSSDDYYGVASDSDIVIKERYKNDAKLHKRCAVVITPTEELIQYERRRDKMYNEILQKQRRKLELRALEKQREKQRRRMGKREEKKETIEATTTTTASAAIATTPNSSKTTVAIDRDRDKIVRRRGRNYNEIFMSSESEFETNFQVRTRKQRQQNAKELQPLKIQIGLTETTTSLLSQIDAHLDTPNSKKTEQKEECLEQQQQPNNKEDDIIKQQQNICDINDKQQQQHTKMRELNLLADIAQHLSPYQLDLPENNTNTNTNININNINTNNKPPLISPLPNQMDDNFNKKFIQTSSSTSTHDEEGVRKDKVTVTEHLIIMQSIDNLLEKPRTTTTTTPTTDHEQHEQASACYASEPKLNIAAIINSSPTNHTNLLQNSENNLTIETNLEETSAPAEPSPEEILKANIPNDEALEQILEESISVLKSVASPFQQLNENETVGETDNGKPVEHHHTTTTIPLLISNVESLNHFEKTETEMPQSNKNKDEINNKPTKDVMEEQKQENKEDEEQNGHICSSLISAVVESSMINTGDLCNISVETEITNALKVPAPLMPADLSDISLESEMSKHLPDIAEPSPVVTDMSDNSNASDVSKAFGLDSNNADLITNQTSTDITLPVLPLEMPNIPAAHTVAAVAIAANGSHETSFDSTLNTPTKLSHNLNREDVLRAQNLTNDLNTPLKFPLTDELTGDNTKNSLVDPEADNNVTKFLDLILNKTVTDAESETRDKIIKELNALTADTTIANSTETVESNKLLETPINEEDKSESLESKRIESEEDKSKKHEEQSNLETALEEPQETKEIEDNKNKTESLENKELNPPKEITQDSMSQEKSLTTEINGKLDINTPLKMKITAIKQTFNIKCRVRLKRLNIAEHCKTKKETWIAIPLTTGTAIATTKSHETEINNLNIKNCDNSMMDASTTSLIKKSCLKYNSNNTNKRLGEDIEINKNLRDIMSGDKENEEEEEVVVIAAKKAKLDEEHLGSGSLEAKQTTLTPLAGQTQTPSEDVSAETNSSNSLFNTSNSSSTSSTPPANTATASSSTKSKNKPLKTVTFDLSNLNEELRDGTTAASMFAHKKSNKNHSSNILSVGGVAVGGGAMGCHLKNSRSPRKLPDNTLRAAETLQIFVNTLNDSNRTPPSAEFNKKRSPIKNKCIAEDETPRPPPAATLMGGVVTPPCKKNCTEKSRSQITSSKCKDQLVSSLATPSITSITNDITTARIYTSSPLDQTLPEYDDNVDTVADTELILPTTTGSLRRKLKRPKKSLTRPEPVDDISTDGISNQPECNGEDDTDAVVDNEDDVFAEELLPIPAANEHILEEIVSARPTHMGPGTVIRDDYMNIEATATVPVYLFNDESRDLATPEPIQSSDTTNVVDSSSYLNTSSSSVTNTVVAASQVASTTSVLGNLEKSMLSPSEHEVSSTQETFYQTPTKNKQNETFGDKSSCNKEKSSSNSNNLSATQKLKMDDNNFLNKEDDQTSSTTGLLQNNQVDTTNHSPEMCTLALTPTTTTTSSSCSANMSSNRKIRKVSTHDEILYNELQQQQQQQQQQPLNKRKTTTTTTTTSCAESTSDNTNTKLKIVNTNILDDNNKTNGSLAKVEDKFKKLLKEVCKGDKNPTKHELNVNDMNTVGGGGGVMEIGDNINGGSGGGGGGSSPSTTTIINEEKLSRSKRKKQKSSKSSKTKNHNERSTKIVLKASKLAAHIPANPLIITIPKSRLLRPPPTPTPTESHDHASLQQDSEFFDIPNAKLFIEKEKDKDKTTTSSTTALTSSTMSSLTSSASSMSVVKNNNHHQHHHQQQQLNKHAATAVHSNKIEHATVAVTGKTKRNQNPTTNSMDNTNTIESTKSMEQSLNTKCTTATKEKSSSSLSSGGVTNKKKIKTNSSSSSYTSSSSSSSNANSSNNLIFVKDKYDLIKSKDKYHHINNNEEKEHKEKLKDKTSSKQNHKTETTTTTTNSLMMSSTTTSNTKHKSSSKEKLKGEKIKEKHKDKESNSNSNNNNSSSSNKSLQIFATNNTSSNSKQSNNTKSNKHASSSSSTSNSSTSSLVLKTKTNNSTSLSLGHLMPSNSSATSTSTINSSASSSSPSVTLTNSHHVRKKLKTK